MAADEPNARKHMELESVPNLQVIGSCIYAAVTTRSTAVNFEIPLLHNLITLVIAYAIFNCSRF